VRIALDLDGVVYQWDKTARYMLRTMRGYDDAPSLKMESQSWDHIQENVEEDDWRWLWTEGVDLGLFRYGHLYPGSIEAIRHLARLGLVEVVTQRPVSATQDTLDFLSYLKLPFSAVHILHQGQGKSTLHADVYIDDGPHVVTDVNANSPTSLLVLMDRPWNGMVQGHFARARSWNEALSVVNTLAMYRLNEGMDPC